MRLSLYERGFGAVRVRHVMRRVALWVTLPLVVVLAGGWTWYRVSDTGKRWRMEDRLASYCDGLLPYEETAALTGLSTESFQNDIRHGGTDARYEFCWVADLYLTVSRVPDGTDSGLLSDDVQFFLPYEDVGALSTPQPLRGGWRGYTDAKNTVTALPCAHGGSIVVTAQSHGYVEDDNADTWPRVDRTGPQREAELAAATALRAADRWGCAVKAPSGPPKVPALHADPDGATGVTEGACAGLRTTADERVTWTRGTDDDPRTLWETCTLGTEAPEYQGDDEGVLYRFSAKYGTQALAARLQDRGWSGGSGTERDDPLRASAKCPGDRERALFTAFAQDETAKAEQLAATTLKTFARLAADRRGCTDLRIAD
ncbi:hypothetical protein ACFV6E_24265 [Streptomyces sp. NPDC059785]|uniref:hypothetical protein n=1 Tax=Streptomyces sp. NPDC059785 TaxID=3346945 RepID=UPI00365E853C